MSPDDDSPDPDLDPPEWADVRIDRPRLVRATPLTLRTKPVEPHSIEPLEYVPILAMQWGSPMRINEFLDFLEPGDDALFARGSRGCFGGLDGNPKRVKEFLVG